MTNRVCAALLGGVFLLSTGFKLLDPGPYLAVGRLLWFSPYMDACLVALAVGEAVLGMFLLHACLDASAPGPRVVAATLALLAVYSGFLVWMLVDGRTIDCGCMGPLKAEPMVGLARNLVLGGVATLLPSEGGKAPDGTRLLRTVLGLLIACSTFRLSWVSWRSWSWIAHQGAGRGVVIVQVDPSCSSCAQLCLWLMSRPALLERVLIIAPEQLPLPSIPMVLLDKGIWRLGPATPTLLNVRNGRVSGAMIGLPVKGGRVDFQLVEAFLLKQESRN